MTQTTQVSNDNLEKKDKIYIKDVLINEYVKETNANKYDNKGIYTTSESKNGKVYI